MYEEEGIGEAEYAGGGAMAPIISASGCIRLNDLDVTGLLAVGDDADDALLCVGCNCSRVGEFTGLEELPEPVRGSGLGMRTLSSTVLSSLTWDGSGTIAPDGIVLSK